MRHRVVCDNQVPVDQPKTHAHIVEVGTGTTPQHYDRLWSVAEVIAANGRGDVFYTLSASTGESARVIIVRCSVCGQQIIRSSADAEKGLRNLLGNPPGKSAIHRMLRNPVYAGIVRWRGVGRDGTHPPLVSRELFDKVQGVLDAHSSGGERGWKHDHYLKGTLVCAECGSKMYFAIAKGRFGYFRCIGRNTGRTRCSQARYVPAAELEREVEALYKGVRIPAALRRRLERVLRVEVAERERHRAEATEFLGRRLRQLAKEREKLLRAYYVDAIDVATLKREQARINAEVAEAESQLATDGEKLKQATKIIDLALDLAKDCAASYRKAKPEVRKMWNQAFFRTIRVQDGRIADSTYEEPFASLLGSHKGSMVDLRGYYSNSVEDLQALLRDCQRLDD